MPEAALLDKIIKNVRVVRPHQQSVKQLDLGIKDGKFAQISPNISPDQAKDVLDA
ncbi:MAG: hydantoinase, partial [Merismopedia sp. SIO2A8]|nr:hydantoinase [Merismopedia sp. SIO2A8]